MTRAIEKAVLEGAAADYATHFRLPTFRRPGCALASGGRDWVLESLAKMFYQDEFKYMLPHIRERMDKRTLADFDDEMARRLIADEHTDERHEQMLRYWLACDPDGNHIKGVRGMVEIARRDMGVHVYEVETPDSIAWRRKRGLPLHVDGRDDRETMAVLRRTTWPIFAGEEEERALGNPNLDSLVLGYGHAMAETTTISYELAAAMLDTLTGRLDEGSTAATIRGRTGTQPTDPDATETGTLLFTLTCSDPVFGAAADQNPNARITASAVTGDASADATNTLTYCRAGATGTGADDHIDGNAATSAASFVFNTVSIVAGATVDLTSWTITMPQGQA